MPVWIWAQCFVILHRVCLLDRGKEGCQQRVLALERRQAPPAEKIFTFSCYWAAVSIRSAAANISSGRRGSSSMAWHMGKGPVCAFYLGSRLRGATLHAKSVMREKRGFAWWHSRTSRTSLVLCHRVWCSPSAGQGRKEDRTILSRESRET